MKNISLVIPVYNSASIMVTLLEAIEVERIKGNWKLELLLIDDGSSDKSYDKIQELSKQYDYIKGCKLSRNFGHQSAVLTGLRLSTGEYIAIIDDDLQDPPSLLPVFFKYLDEGYDVAYGVRRKRKESFLKVLSYKYFYKILRALSSIEIPLDSGDFCVMNRRVLDNMLSLNEVNPFLRGIRSWVGFNQIGVEYNREARFEGKSGYSLRKLLSIASDGIFSFSNLPLRLTTVLGFFSLSFAIVYSLYLLTKYFFVGISSPGFSTIALMILFFGSVNLICLGIIGEYIARIYSEGKKRPHSIISESFGFNQL
ncbi:MAG: dolichol-phosphate mannosyltransferase [Bacteriovoracaceae bacterium]|jgi:dolichol-phosphate mannosyltransferase